MNSMQFYFITNFSLLRPPRTNQIFDVRFCEGIASNGYKVFFHYPFIKFKESIKHDDIYHHYNITSENLKIIQKRTPLRENSNQIFAVLVNKLFNIPVLFTLLYKIFFHKITIIIISRHINQNLLFILIKKILFLKKLKIVSSVPELKLKKIQNWILRSSDLILSYNSKTLKDIQINLSIKDNRIINFLSPIPTSFLNNEISKNMARDAIIYNINIPLIVYTGKLNKNQKEIEYIIEAAKILPDYKFLFTGGDSETVKYYQNYCKERNIFNTIFVGYQLDQNRINLYQRAADVLVSYYTMYEHMTDYNFPQKITEYMVTGNPIVTPNFPATQDVLNEKNAIFVEAENPEALAEGIRKSIEDTEFSSKIAQQALVDVKELTFEKRTKLIINFFQKETLKNPA